MLKRPKWFNLGRSWPCLCLFSPSQSCSWCCDQEHTCLLAVFLWDPKSGANWTHVLGWCLSQSSEWVKEGGGGERYLENIMPDAAVWRLSLNPQSWSKRQLCDPSTSMGRLEVETLKVQGSFSLAYAVETQLKKIALLMQVETLEVVVWPPPASLSLHTSALIHLLSYTLTYICIHALRMKGIRETESWSWSSIDWFRTFHHIACLFKTESHCRS